MLQAIISVVEIKPTTISPETKHLPPSVQLIIIGQTICFDKIWLALEPIAGISIKTIFSIKNGNGICPGDTLVLGSLLNIPLNIFFPQLLSVPRFFLG